MQGADRTARPIAEPTVLHATCVCVGDRGVVILGCSGSGKSGLALQLMAHGADLVADDRTMITLADGALRATAPVALSGMIEARGVGLLRAQAAGTAMLWLAVDMDQTESDRLPPWRCITLAGVTLPCLHKVDSPYFPAAVLQYLKAGRRD